MSQHTRRHYNDQRYSTVHAARASKPKTAIVVGVSGTPVRKQSKKLYGGYCCPVLHLAVSRARDTDRTGIRVGQMFVASGKRLKPRQAVVIYFPKAKKGDEAPYPEHANSTYAECDFCPFCGAAITEDGKDRHAARVQGQQEAAAKKEAKRE